MTAQGLESRKLLTGLLMIWRLFGAGKLIRERSTKAQKLLEQNIWKNDQFFTFGFHLQVFASWVALCSIMNSHRRNYCSQLITTNAVKISVKQAHIND